jgi:hypothetical protein
MSTWKVMLSTKVWHYLWKNIQNNLNTSVCRLVKYHLYDTVDGIINIRLDYIEDPLHDQLYEEFQ